MKKLLLSLFFLCLISNQAIAAMDGYRLKTHLIDFNSASSASLMGGFGAGYVLGIHDEGVGVFFCTNQVTVQQLVNVVLAYLLANPERLDKQGSVLVSNALANKWPCKERQSNVSPKPQTKPIPKSESPF